MSKRLKDDDAHVVDFLLQNNGQASEDSGVMYAPPADVPAQRIEAAESLLKLVGEMPAAAPPVDLVRKTLDHIRHHGAVVPGSADGHHPLLGQGPNSAS